jgi:hypothetical protein
LAGAWASVTWAVALALLLLSTRGVSRAM